MTLFAASAASAAPVVDGEFALPFGPNQVAPGPDGNMWVTQSNSVVRFSPANPALAQAFAVDITNPQEIVAGPDGNLWTASADKVFKIPTDGNEQQLSGIVQSARGIAAGSDGLIWVVDFQTKQVLSFTTGGAAITPHAVGSGDPQDVAAGPAGQVAYTSPSNEIGRLTAGSASAPTATPGADPFGIAFGADQAYWSAQFATNNLGRLTADGQYSTLGGFAANSGPRRIAAGPNNTLWVTLETTGKLARVSGLEPPDTTPPVIGGFSVRPRVFRVGRGQTPVITKRVPVGTKFRYTLSEPAAVTLTISRKQAGRRVGTRCLTPRKSLHKRKKCVRLIRAGVLTRAGVAGANSVSFSGRIGRRALKPGAYEVQISATDAAGNASTHVFATSFTVRPRR